MTIVIHQKIKVLDTETTTKIFYPAGTITDDQRNQAIQLDEFLKKEISERIRIIEKKMVLTEYNIDLYKWYLLGKWLIKLINTQKLVRQTDVETGVLWRAIWQYIPPSFSKINEGEFTDKNSSKKNRDYLHLSYELAKFEWEDVRWMNQWWFWLQINHTPAIIRDQRIFLSLGKHIKNKIKKINRDKFLKILKDLSEDYKSGKDSLILKDQEIDNNLNEIISKI